MIVPGITDLAWAVCARESSHLINLIGISLPFCARCTAWYSGIGLTMIILFSLGSNQRQQFPKPLVSLLIISGLIVMGGDAITDFLGWRTANLGTRLFTGFFAGAGIPVLLIPIRASFNAAEFRGQGINMSAAVGFWSLAGVHAAITWQMFEFSDFLKYGWVIYLTCLTVFGLGALLYLVSSIVLTWSLRKTVFDSCWGGWVLATAIMTVLYRLHIHITGKPY